MQHLLLTTTNNAIDLPSWLSAVGTVGAFAIALWLLRVQLIDRRKYLVSQRETSARRVSAWCDLTRKQPIIWVQNLGEEPVYNVVVYAGKVGVDFNSQPFVDGNDYVELGFGVVPPGSKLDFSVDRDIVSGDRFPDLPSIAIEFTDANQVHWRRESDGKIIEVSCRRPFD